jgi:hypothetical protein
MEEAALTSAGASTKPEGFVLVPVSRLRTLPCKPGLTVCTVFRNLSGDSRWKERYRMMKPVLYMPDGRTVKAGQHKPNKIHQNGIETNSC